MSARHLAGSILALILALMVVLTGAAASAAAPAANAGLPAAVLDEINFARTHPAEYAETLARGPRTPATEEAIAFVSRQAPLPPLAPDARLDAAAGKFAAEAGPAGRTGHTGADGSSAGERIHREGVFASLEAEDISLGQESAAGVVRQLVIDEGVPTRAHRSDIFHPLLRFAGIGCGPHRVYRAMCVIDLAGAIMTAGSEAAPPPVPPPPEPSRPRAEPGEVVIEVATDAPDAAIAALERRYRLTVLERLDSQLSGTTLLRAVTAGGWPVSAVIAALGGEPAVISAQPNQLFELQQRAAPAAAPLQYALARMRLAEAPGLARGAGVLVGMIDSGVDGAHPDLAGALAGTFDAYGGAGGPASHGTAIAGAIAAHGRLTGTAPAARILAVRAFDAAGEHGSSFTILKGLDWLAARGARVINMSFAGPADPAIHRGLEGAWRRGIVLIAAAGNAGPASPPLYPAADPRVIAVAASDAHDQIAGSSNRAAYIAIAAPGVDILAAAPDDAYQVLSGTSFAAAEVSGIAALILERRPRLDPEAVRALLTATARRGVGAGARVVDAYGALMAR